MMSSDFLIFDKLNFIYPEDISFIPVHSPYVFLVTVMLSASSTDVRAIAASDRLFSEYPDAKAVSEADEDAVEAIIHDVGLARSKARNIIGVSKFVTENGIPDTMAGLTALPGIGEKTASCYLSTIKGEPAVIADIHFVRVAYRLGLIHTQDRNGAAKEIRERFPEEYWTRLSMTVNLHGRRICRPKPKCSECFLRELCPYEGVSV